MRPPLTAAHLSYVRSSDRSERSLGRALVPRILSRITGVPAAEWRFRTNQYGRPEIASPESASQLRFSLSHTRGLVVCLTAWNRLVGVDVERIRYADSLLQVADRVCTAEEAAALRGFHGTERHRRFLERWTLKEAYLKARGVGLSLRPDRVSFPWEEQTGEIRASFAPELSDNQSRWRFTLHRISHEHIVASAIELAEGAPADLVVTDAERLLRRRLEHPHRIAIPRLPE